ncbi:MAG: winged helix-turn-helix transcriptional regulator [Flavobacteriaceae bacterium]|nr:winged helix-turn-helix transcriptional regulator [Flavobacteriaceae bacterium]
MSTLVKSHENVCYLHRFMSNITKYFFRSFTILVIFTCILSCSSERTEEFSGIVKVSLRDVGHRLLLANQDSTSLVLPVVMLDKLKYQLSFEKHLSIEPNSLVAIVKSSFQKAGLPQDYLVEVIQCKDEEVAYSYEIKLSQENDIIPCRGRILPNACYIINVRFANTPKTITSNSRFLYLLALGFLLLVAFVFYKRKNKGILGIKDEKYTSIGSFQFYPGQNKLIKEAVEISLSKKECDLLAIFIAKPNQIIKRDELTKRVWEDHGVIVGRSLDTYISKLRNILREDSSIKISNVHGVGYKLEILK